MEIVVDVIKFEFEGLSDGETSSLTMECQAKAGREVRRQPLPVHTPGTAREQQKWPQFKLLFSQPTSSINLSLAIKDTSQNTVSMLGSTNDKVILQHSSDRRLKGLLRQSSDQTRIGIVVARIEDTDVTRFVGRIWYRVTQVFITPTVLFSHELEHACHEIFPSVTPTVSVIFHCLHSSSALGNDRLQLKPVARLGASTGEVGQVGNFQILDVGKGDAIVATSILKAVTLSCDGKPNLELYLCNTLADAIVFSTSHVLQSLTPFWHYHWHLTPSVITSEIALDQSSKVIISVTYTPPQSQYSQYKGLEVFILGLELTPNACNNDVLICVQLTSSKNKSRVLNPTSNEPPFLKARKKGTPENFNIYVARTQTAFGHSNTTKPVYNFYSEDTHFLNESSDAILSITVYAVDTSNSSPWWQSSLVASCRLSLTSEVQRALQLPVNHRGVYWELTGRDIYQEGGRILAGNVYGVVRWKTSGNPFLNRLVQGQLHSLPNIPEALHLSRTQQPLDQPTPQLSVSPDPPPRSEILHSSAGEQDPLPASLYPHLSTEGIVIPAVGELSFLLAEQDLSGEHEEVESRIDERRAIIDLGKDIIRLREENCKLQRRNEELSKEVTELQFSEVTDASADAKSLEGLPTSKLIQRISQLQQILQTESKSRELYRDRVQKLQKELIQKNEMEVGFIHLQEAHSAQQKLVRQLQAKVTKYRRCGVICKQQEKLISSLEALLVQRAQGTENADALALLTRENSALRAAIQEYQDCGPDHKYLALREKEDEIHLLREQVTELTTRCQELEDQLRCGRASGGDGRVFELEQQLAVSEARVNALMRELRESAQQWATEIAHYEIQLAEYRSKAAQLVDRVERNASEAVNTGRHIQVPISSPDRHAPTKMTF